MRSAVTARALVAFGVGEAVAPPGKLVVRAEDQAIGTDKAALVVAMAVDLGVVPKLEGLAVGGVVAEAAEAEGAHQGREVGCTPLKNLVASGK